ncbi:MAG: DUF1987 domain-containing protein [Bacteroidota bacterium]
MEVLKIKQTEEFPAITLDKDNGVFCIKGESTPENAGRFFTPIINWFKQYHENPNEKTVLEFKFKYYNTATTYMIYEILKIMKRLEEGGKDVMINWYYQEADEEIIDQGMEFAELIDMEFNFISVEKI